MASPSPYDHLPRRAGSALPPALGTVVAGKYRILRSLGEGGMGAVFEVENLITLKRAAIKWVHPRVRDLADASQRLILEARAAARVRHRNVVDIYDAVVEDDSLFLVMELLLGEPLNEHIARGGSSVHEVIALLLPAMSGVAAAHAVGVVHRDIKPQNIFLAREAGDAPLVAKVIDFGISRIFASGDTRLTSSGITMGTPRYVCFEQLRGARDVDGRADIYAFGVILYETIVGRPPYDATSFGEQAINFVTTSPPEPKAVRPNVPDALNALLLAAIAKERDERLASMEEFIHALAPFASADAFTQGRLAAFPPRPGSQQTNPVDPAQITAPQDGTPLPAATPGKSGVTLARSSPAFALRGTSRVRLALAAVALGAALAALAWWSRAADPGRAMRSSPSHDPLRQHEAVGPAQQHADEAPATGPMSQPVRSTAQVGATDLPAERAPGAAAPNASPDSDAPARAQRRRKQRAHPPSEPQRKLEVVTPPAGTESVANTRDPPADTVDRAANMSRDQF